MPFVVANDFDYAVYDSIGYLRVATFGRSVFEAELGPIQPTDVIETEEQLLTFNLKQNYPNPFNPITRIQYSISEKSKVTLAIFNPLGEKVTALVDEIKDTGSYEVIWNAEGFPSGVYFYKIETEKYVDVRKMLLLK